MINAYAKAQVNLLICDVIPLIVARSTRAVEADLEDDLNEE